MFYYYGGKRRLAGFYPRPRHDVIVEPFGGSAAYALYHLDPARTAAPVKRAIVVEKDPRVCETWERLLAMEPDELRSYPIPEVGARTEDFLLMTAAASNRIARTRSMLVTERMPTVIERMFRQIAELLPHAKGKVEVIKGDYRLAPDVEATWFIDPPYHVNGRPQSRGMGYAEECNSFSLDYEALAEWCRARRGQKIVCEQSGATWLPFEHLRSARNSIGNKSDEVFWTDPVDQLELTVPGNERTRGGEPRSPDVTLI